MASSVLAAFAKKDEVYASKILYRELGYYISRLEQFERALKYFDVAISKAPNDRRALMGRAWVRSKTCHYEKALNDLKTALDIDPDDMTLLAHKALITFLSCEFESGLVQNTRLIPKRQKPESFKMGAMHCANAIENCLGERSGRPLRDHFLIIRKLAWKKNFEQQVRFIAGSKNNKKKKLTKEMKPFDQNGSTARREILPIIPSMMSKHKEIRKPSEDDLTIVDSIHSQKLQQNTEPPPIKFPYRPLQHHTSNIKNYMAEKYLDTLYNDKLFLKSMMKHPGLASPNEVGTAKILNLTKTGYKAVKYQQELLRTRRPFYFIKYQETSSSGNLKIRQEQELNKIIMKTKRDADYFVSKMKDALDGKNWFLLLDYAERLKKFCKTSKKILPNREEYLHFIYETVCQAHFDLKRLNPNQEEWEAEKRIYKLLGLQLTCDPSTDSIVAQFKDVFIDWKKQAAVYNERLRKATTSRELCWLFHELSRFNIELKQYDIARVYAKQCINEAKRIQNNKWIINSLMLLIRINIAQHSKNDAKNDAIEAIEIAKKMNDDNLVTFFTKCRDVIDSIAFDARRGTKVLVLREKKILEMMAGDQMKDEAEYLFKTMASMPPQRRMSVLPGIVPDDDDDDKRRKSKGKLSIAGTPKRDETKIAESLIQKRSAQFPAKNSKGAMSLVMLNLGD